MQSRLNSPYQIQIDPEIDAIEKRVAYADSYFDSIFTIPIKDKGVVKYVALKDVIMIKSYSNYSFIYIKNQLPIMTSKTLRHWFLKIKSAQFIRVHASFLINRFEIKEFKKVDRKLLMTENLEAKISRAGMHLFIHAMQSL